MDPYDILGVTRDSPDDEIKKKYRTLAKQYHPDLNEGDKESESKFKEINEAFSKIENAEKRQQFDLEQNPFQGFNNSPFGTDSAFAHDILRDIFGSDVFSSSGFQTNKNVNITYHANLEDLYFGKDCVVNFKLDNKEHNVKFHIKPGMIDGTRIRIAGKGQNNFKHLPPGDLFVTIKAKSHPNFNTHGSTDLFHTARVDVFTATTGGIIEVTHIDGNDIKFKIPASTQHGTTFIVQGKGMPVNESMFGDLYLTIDLFIPELNEQQMKTVQELKKSIDSV